MTPGEPLCEAPAEANMLGNPDHNPAMLMTLMDEKDITPAWIPYSGNF
jgi:hypothetical protein